MIAQTEKLGIVGDTVFLFSTDNATTQYGKGLKGTIKEHGPKVPALAYGPGRVKARGEVDDLASLADFAPTVTDLSGAQLPEDYEFDGINLMPFLSGGTTRHRDWVYSYNAEFQFVRTRNLLRDGMGFYWDTRHTVDQEAYPLVDESAPDPALKKEMETIQEILKKYPAMPKSGPMYERYMKDKAGKRQTWEKMRERIMKEYKTNKK